MIIFSEIFLTFTAVLFGALFIRASMKDGFDQRETVQLLLGLLSIYGVYNFDKFGLWGLTLVLGSLLLSVKIEVINFNRYDNQGKN